MEVLVFQASNYKVHDEPSNELEAFPLVFSLHGRSDPLRWAGDFQGFWRCLLFGLAKQKWQ